MDRKPCESTLLFSVAPLLLFLPLEIESLVCSSILQQSLEKTILKLQIVVDWGNASMDIMTRIRSEFSRQVPFQIMDLT